MSEKTASELLFESFCNAHAVSWAKVPESRTKTPDYIVSLNGQSCYFEIKQIDKDENFEVAQHFNTGIRTVGAHIRQKIFGSKKQVQAGAEAGAPSILLIYNNLDPLQAFGTEQHDFIAAMYGEMTLTLQGGQIVDSYNGRNSLLREDQNTSFSAVGHLRATAKTPTVRLYENAYARNPLSNVPLPTYFEVIHFEITH